MKRQLSLPVAQPHPEVRDRTIWGMFEAERASLVAYAGRFDGFHAVPATISKTCLVRFDNNKYSVSASAVDRPVEIRAYADRIELRQDGRVQDLQAAFIIANLDRLRALPVMRVRGAGREADLSERQLDARRRVHKTMQALGGMSSPAGSCVWHVVGLQRSVREWALRMGWGGRPLRQERAQGVLIAALGMLAAHKGYAQARRTS